MAKEQKADIQYLESKIERLKYIDKNAPEIEIYRSKLRKIYTDMGEGAKIRSRVEWWEEGERSTRYFHQIEKRKGKE